MVFDDFTGVSGEEESSYEGRGVQDYLLGASLGLLSTEDVLVEESEDDDASEDLSAALSAGSYEEDSEDLPEGMSTSLASVFIV